ncbi:tol-pal system protein YbgF, partial [Candidatus Pelagibacter sp.]|nr:tol-pal system protein YbgF [Candidatus Pelagibacter sp.]
MKRLLAYLFIVFGLGLTFNVSANADDYVKKLSTQISDCWQVPMGIPYKDNLIVEVVLTLNKSGKLLYSKILDQDRMYKPDQGYYKVLAESVLRAVKICEPFNLPVADYKKWEKTVLKFDAKKILYNTASIETKAKKIVKKNGLKDAKDFDKPEEYYKYATSFLKLGDYINSAFVFTDFVEIYPKNKLAGNAQYWLAETFRVRQQWDNAVKEYLYGFINYPDSSKAPINLLKLGVSLVTIGERDIGCNIITAIKKTYPKANKSIISKAEYETKKFDCGRYDKNWRKQIPTIYAKLDIEKNKPKKKTKVAKVEPKQEEFKPKKTNQDKEAPVIEIAEAITVNDTDYEFQGKVTDKAKTIYVEVDGRPTDVKNGKFTVKGYSPIDKQISIEAIDQWGNRSEPKIVKLTIDIKDTSIAEKLEPLNPSKIRSKSSNNKVALIIGIENYLESPNATYFKRLASSIFVFL